MADNNNVNIKALKVIDLVCIFSFRIYNNFISMERERGRERTNFKIIFVFTHIWPDSVFTLVCTKWDSHKQWAL